MTMMRRFSFLVTAALAALLAATSCGPKGNGFRIEGRLKGMQPGEIYIYNQSDAQARFDTLKVKDGSFVYEGNATQPTPYVLVFQNGLEQVVFADGGQTLEYSASANDMKNYEVKGSDENTLLNEFRKETAKMTAIKTKAAARSFIEGHPASPVSVYMLDRYFVQDTDIDYDELMTLVKLLRKNMEDNIFLINLETDIGIIQNGMTGHKIPAVQMTTKTGKTVDLGKHTKPFTLVGFWSTWVNEAWDFMSALRTYATGYSNEMQVVAVSLDNQIYKWEEFVRSDSLTLDNVCDGKSWNSDYARKFGVRQLPFFVLADKTGKILVSGKTTDAMKKEVEKRVKKNSATDTPTDTQAEETQSNVLGQ